MGLAKDSIHPLHFGPPLDSPRIRLYSVIHRLDPIFRGYQFTGEVRPGKQTPQMTVPDSIMKPDYASDRIRHSHYPSILREHS